MISCRARHPHISAFESLYNPNIKNIYEGEVVLKQLNAHFTSIRTFKL